MAHPRRGLDMKKVFVDVGLHRGFTIIEAMDPAYGFDRIFGFEPSPACWSRLSEFRDPRLNLIRAGLGRENCTATLHGSGGIGASIYSDKPAPGLSEKIDLFDAAEWTRAHLSPNDVNLLKLNCEGAEADILERLADEGLLSWFRAILVSFDIDKIPSQQNRHAVLEKRLEGFEDRITDRKRYTKAGNYRIRAWLDEQLGRSPTGTISRMKYRLGVGLPWRTQRGMVAKLVLPRPIFQVLSNSRNDGDEQPRR
jgi:FkbM family methyltransferase